MVYFTFITAVNWVGEGYKPKDEGQYVKTMHAGMKDPCSLYCWGDNSWSQLGLSEEALEENKFIRNTVDGTHTCVTPTLNK